MSSNYVWGHQIYTDILWRALTTFSISPISLKALSTSSTFPTLQLKWKISRYGQYSRYYTFHWLGFTHIEAYLAISKVWLSLYFTTCVHNPQLWRNFLLCPGLGVQHAPSQKPIFYMSYLLVHTQQTFDSKLYIFNLFQ